VRRKVEVTAYAGQRSEEQPRSFILEGEKIAVVELRDQWIEEDAGSTRRKRCFRVKGSNGFSYLLSHDEQTGEWSLEQ
jgi:hypothetical protein